MLTEFQKQKLPKLFIVHDVNADGVLTRADFEDYARMIAGTRGWGTDVPEYKELLACFLKFWDGLEEVADHRGSRQVTLSAWYEHWDRILNTPGMYDQVIEPIGRMVFTILDQDGDGAVTGEEYAATFKYSGLDEAVAAAAFDRLDLDHDGRISVDEIMVLADQFFRSDDPNQPGNALFGVVVDPDESMR
jgi:juvenile hormone diol kinase